MLHGAHELLALAGAGDVDVLARGEGVDGWPSAHRVGGGVSGADLDQVATRGRPGLDEVTGLRLAHLAAIASRRTRPERRRPSVSGRRTWVTTLVFAAITVTGTIQVVVVPELAMLSLVPSRLFTLCSKS